MSLTILVAVQWLHILMGTAWFGCYIFLDFIMWPTFLRLPIAQAKVTSAVITKFASPVMATSGTLVVLLGIIRGTLLGPIKSFSFLFTSVYGIAWLVALTVSLMLIIWGAGWHDRVIGPVWEEDHVRPGAVSRLRIGAVFEMTSFGIVLACMVFMSET
jgi:uncharacterized membrane protein